MPNRPQPGAMPQQKGGFDFSALMSLLAGNGETTPIMGAADAPANDVGYDTGMEGVTSAPNTYDPNAVGSITGFKGKGMLGNKNAAAMNNQLNMLKATSDVDSANQVKTYGAMTSGVVDRTRQLGNAENQAKMSLMLQENSPEAVQVKSNAIRQLGITHNDIELDNTMRVGQLKAAQDILSRFGIIPDQNAISDYTQNTNPALSQRQSDKAAIEVAKSPIDLNAVDKARSLLSDNFTNDKNIQANQDEANLYNSQLGAMTAKRSVTPGAFNTDANSPAQNALNMAVKQSLIGKNDTFKLGGSGGTIFNPTTGAQTTIADPHLQMLQNIINGNTTTQNQTGQTTPPPSINNPDGSIRVIRNGVSGIIKNGVFIPNGARK